MVNVRHPVSFKFRPHDFSFASLLPHQGAFQNQIGILNAVKNPSGHRLDSSQNLAGSFTALLMNSPGLSS
jgi:hypothetical protein